MTPFPIDRANKRMSGEHDPVSRLSGPTKLNGMSLCRTVARNEGLDISIGVSVQILSEEAEVKHRSFTHYCGKICTECREPFYQRVAVLGQLYVVVAFVRAGFASSPYWFAQSALERLEGIARTPFTDEQLQAFVELTYSLTRV
jgi:hypothetical protein